MVITTCGSCNTLVSIDDGINKQHDGDFSSGSSCEEHAFSKTELLLPEDNFGCNDDDYWSMCSANNARQGNVFLPCDETDAVDHCLRSNPSIMESAEELLAKSPRIFSSESKERVLYVAQGEMAHALPSQCDVIVSDKSTTCHILAVRSTSASGNTQSLVSLTHVDGAMYEDCIRNMIAEHKIHHGMSQAPIVCGYTFEDEKKEEGVASEQIQMELHLVGGFEDVNGASRDISNFLVHLLARIANEEGQSLCMTLKTCAISSMNDNGYSCPIGRGMGIDLFTGEAFLAKVETSAAGPLQELRSVRLWMNHGPKELSIIHTENSDDFVVSPFFFQPFQEVDMLLNVDDEVLLQCTSTSPDVEEDDFCDSVRTSLRYLCNNQCHKVFANGEPLLHRRVATSNCWKSR